MAYDSDLRVTVGPRCTVGELKAILNDIPDSHEVTCCGQEEFFLHRDDEDEIITFDTDQEVVEDDIDDLDL